MNIIHTNITFYLLDFLTFSPASAQSTTSVQPLVTTTPASYKIPWSAGFIEDEPSDYEVWSAIVSSMAKWEEMRKKKHRIRKRSEEVVCYRGFGCFRDEGNHTSNNFFYMRHVVYLFLK